MPVLINEKYRIQVFKDTLARLGLRYNRDYRLEDTGEVWVIAWMQPSTVVQSKEAEVLLGTMLNS